MRSRLVEVGKDLTAGTMAGIAQLLVGHPFDTVKVKLQSQMAAGMSNQPAKYTGAWDAVRKIMATEGPAGLYRGLSAPLAAVALFNAVLFAARGQMEAFLSHNKKVQPYYTTLSVRQQMVAGVGAGLAVSFVACPTELIKCRLQAQSTTTEPAPPSPTTNPPPLEEPNNNKPNQPTPHSHTPNPNRNPNPPSTDIDIGLRTLVLTPKQDPQNPKNPLDLEVPRSHVPNPNPNPPSTDIDIGLRTLVLTPQQYPQNPQFDLEAPQTHTPNPNSNPNPPPTDTDIGLRTLDPQNPLDLEAPAIFTQDLDPGSHKYTGSLDVAMQIFRSEGGVLGFFKGLSPTFLREVFGNAAYFGSYQGTKQLLSRGGTGEDLSTGSLLLAGGVAGAMFWLCVYPADVIKSMIQVDDHRHPKYSGAFDAFRQVLKSQGMQGFYCGFGPAMARSILANAVCFYVYELVRKAFK